MMIAVSCLRGGKESIATHAQFPAGWSLSSQFVTAKKYPDLNRCALVLMTTNAADYVQAEALLAKYYAKKNVPIGCSTKRCNVAYLFRSPASCSVCIKHVGE